MDSVPILVWCLLVNELQSPFYCLSEEAFRFRDPAFSCWKYLVRDLQRKRKMYHEKKVENQGGNQPCHSLSDV